MFPNLSQILGAEQVWSCSPQTQIMTRNGMKIYMNLTIKLCVISKSLPCEMKKKGESTMSLSTPYVHHQWKIDLSKHNIFMIIDFHQQGMGGIASASVATRRTKCLAIIALQQTASRVAQWKRAGPITQRSVDRNYALLNLLNVK